MRCLFLTWSMAFSSIQRRTRLELVSSLWMRPLSLLALVPEPGEALVYLARMERYSAPLTVKPSSRAARAALRAAMPFSRASAHAFLSFANLLVAV